MKKLLIVILLSFSFVASAQQLNIALLKYRGGGDKYSLHYEKCLELVG